MPKRAVNQNVEPTPSSLVTPTSPPMSSTSRLTMDKPKPVPPNLRVVDASTWLKAWNSAFIRFAGMPMPVSRISQRTSTPSALRSMTLQPMAISPCCVNFTALPPRLSRI